MPVNSIFLFSFSFFVVVLRKISSLATSPPLPRYFSIYTREAASLIPFSSPSLLPSTYFSLSGDMESKSAGVMAAPSVFSGGFGDFKRITSELDLEEFMKNLMANGSSSVNDEYGDVDDMKPRMTTDPFIGGGGGGVPPDHLNGGGAAAFGNLVSALSLSHTSHIGTALDCSLRKVRWSLSSATSSSGCTVR